MKRRSVSSVLAEVILILIVLVASLVVYEIVVNKGVAFQGGASVSISGAKVQPLGGGLALLTVTVTNTGSVPELVGVYVSGLSSSFSYAQSTGYMYVAYENLPSGTYSFSSSSLKAVFIEGPSTNYAWEQVSGSASLSAGAYEIAVFAGSGISTNLPSSTRWLITYYAIPQGDALSISATQPWNLSAFGAVVLGEGTAVTSSPSYSSQSGVQPGIPLGVLKGGQSKTISVLISGSYEVGQSVLVVAEAWTPSGSPAVASVSVSVT